MQTWDMFKFNKQLWNIFNIKNIFHENNVTILFESSITFYVLGVRQKIEYKSFNYSSDEILIYKNIVNFQPVFDKRYLFQNV